MKYCCATILSNKDLHFFLKSGLIMAAISIAAFFLGKVCWSNCREGGKEIINWGKSFCREGGKKLFIGVGVFAGNAGRKLFIGVGLFAGNAGKNFL